MKKKDFDIKNKDLNARARAYFRFGLCEKKASTVIVACSPNANTDPEEIDNYPHIKLDASDGLSIFFGSTAYPLKSN